MQYTQNCIHFKTFAFNVPAKAFGVFQIFGKMRAVDEHLLGYASADHAGAVSGPAGPSGTCRRCAADGRWLRHHAVDQDRWRGGTGTGGEGTVAALPPRHVSGGRRKPGGTPAHDRGRQQSAC